MKINFNPIMPVEDDGLETNPARVWSEKKYKLLGGYCNIFTSAMRKKWDKLIYIDLFSGSGYAKIQETGQILKASPLIALSIPVSFDVYIFAEEETKYLDALKRRVNRDYCDSKVYYFEGDCNKNIDLIKEVIPKHSYDQKVLIFCFADPYEMNLHFKTIDILTHDKLIDILILQAYYMDANRNFNNYLNDNNTKIAKYLNDDAWREDFNSKNLNEENFVTYLADKYKENKKSNN
jgi:three-Cys-motif partner protein